MEQYVYPFLRPLEPVFLGFVNRSLTALWLVAAVLVARLALKRAPKWAHCLLWALVALRLILPLNISSPLSAFNAADTPVNESGEVEYVRYVGEGVKPMAILDWSLLVPYETLEQPAYDWTSDDSGPPVARAHDAAYLPPLVAAWLVGAAGMIVYAIASYVKLRRRVAASIPLGDGVWLCDDIASPFILGVVRARIYLPSGMDDAQRELVIAHERAHLKRRDHWWKPLGFALLALYWFNPGLWLAYILLCRDIELACDERVLRELGSAAKKPYSEALLACSAPRRLVSACPVAFGEVGVKERVRAVLSYKKPAFWLVAAAVAACAVVAVCFLTNPVRKEDGQPVEQLAAELPLRPLLSEALIDDWARYDAMDDMSRMASSHLPGHCYRGFETWEEGTAFLGTAPWNPLEDAGWLAKRNYAGAEIADPFDGVLYHAYLMWTGERDGTVTYASLQAGYADGNDVRVTLTVEPLRRWAEPDAAGAERLALGDGTSVLLTRDSGKAYDAETLYFEKGGYYTVHLVSLSGTRALDAAREHALETLGGAEPRGVAFTNVMGLDGWYEDTNYHNVNSRSRAYYASASSGEAVRIGESYGQEIDDYVLDLDGDGVTELICNLLAGDGTHSVRVYRRRGDIVEQGYITRSDTSLPGSKAFLYPVWAVEERWEPEEGAFVVDYPVAGDEKRTARFTDYSAFEWVEYAVLDYDAWGKTVAAFSMVDIRASSEKVESYSGLSPQEASVPKALMGETLVDETLPTGQRIVLFHRADIDDVNRKYWAVDRGDTLEAFCVEDAWYPDGYSVSTYENVLGHDGFRIHGPRGAGYDFTDYYTFDADGAPRFLASVNNSCTEVDIDGDGQREIVSLYHYWGAWIFWSWEDKVYRTDLNALVENTGEWAWRDFDLAVDGGIEERIAERGEIPVLLADASGNERHAALRLRADGVDLIVNR